jgi:PAS domain S-box-containing protein
MDGDLLDMHYRSLLDRLTTLSDRDAGGARKDLPWPEGAMGRLATMALSLGPHVIAAQQGAPGGHATLVAAMAELRAELAAVVDNAGQVLDAQIADQRRAAWLAMVLMALSVLALGLAMLGLGAMVLRLARINRQQDQGNRLAGARLETVVSTSQDAIIVTDGSERITGFNRAAEQMFSMAESLARGRLIGDLVFQADGRALTLQGRDAGRLERHQLTGRDAVGRDFPVELSLGSALRDGTQIHVFFLRDISDRLAAEADLRQSRDRALAGERAKAQFLAVMSHEMRTPLTGILGAIELMRATDDAGAGTRDYLDVLQSSGEVLLGHVNDVLGLSEIDQMGVNLSDRRFDMDALLQDVIRSLTPVARRQSCTVMLSCAPDALGWFRGDPARLRQIMVNLLGNAIKFTPGGEVSVEVTAAPDAQGLILGRHRIEIQVADTGAGIPAHQLDRIFEDFVRIEDGGARRTEGTGLGLGIVKRLVSAMGGKLGVESIEGEGSLFWVSLSLPQVARPETPDLPLLQDGTTPARKVLLVEDDATNRFILREMLLRDGHDVIEAADGRDGVARAAQTAFDLILMDVNMPVMDGLAAAEAIREGDGPSARARIVALTAHVFDRDHRRYRDAGMDDIAIKPLGWDGLRRILHGQSVAPGADQEGKPGAANGHETPLLDEAVLGQLHLTLGPLALGRLLDQFQAEGRAALSSITEGISGPRQMLRDRLHGFAGQAAIFGARRLHYRLATIEDRMLSMTEEEIARMRITIEDLWTDTSVQVMHYREMLPKPSLSSELRRPLVRRDDNDPRRLL